METSDYPSVLLLLDIDVTAPLIVFPELSTSTSYLIADLGKCVITNSMELDKDISVEEEGTQRGRSGMDVIKASLSSVKLMMYATIIILLS